MEAREYFSKLPVKDVGAVAASGLQRNTLPTMGIYTNSARTVLATVYVAASGGTTKVNPVAQNVGGNNSYEGYLTAGQPYFWRVGDASDPDATIGQFYAGTDTYPSGVEMGVNSGGTATGTSLLRIDTTPTQFWTNIYRNSIRQAKIFRYGSLIWDNDSGDYIKDTPTVNFFQAYDYDTITGNPDAQNMNNFSIFPVFYIDTLDEAVGVRALNIRDTSQSATITMGRTGNNGNTVTAEAVNADINLSQILTQGDAKPAAETSYQGVQAAMYVLSTGNFSLTSKPTQMFFVTSAVNDFVATPDGHLRFGLFDDGGVRIYPQDVAGTISHNGLRAVAGMHTLHNDAGVLKTKTFAGTDKAFALLPTTIQDYTVTNPVTRRSFDTTTITLPQLAEAVGTIIADMITFGVFQ